MTVFLLLFVGLLNIFINFPQYLKFPSQLFVSFLSILISTAEFRRPTRKRGGLEASPTDRLRVVSITVDHCGAMRGTHTATSKVTKRARSDSDLKLLPEDTPRVILAGSDAPTSDTIILRLQKELADERERFWKSTQEQKGSGSCYECFLCVRRSFSRRSRLLHHVTRAHNSGTNFFSSSKQLKVAKALYDEEKNGPHGGDNWVRGSDALLAA